MGDEAGAGVIAGRFRLGGLLGSGGTASVFSAVDTATGRRVAVKLLHPHLSENPAVRTAFLDEARRIATLSHPCVVTIVDLGTFLDGGTPIAWIAQQLVEGTSLAEYVPAGEGLAPAAAVEVASDVLSGLAAVHRAGLVHRDVSPANVLVRPVDGVLRATLLDFGLADAAGETTHGDDVLRSSVTDATAGVVGNAHFASPEQLSGRPVGPAGDLYQVGGLLYFALTGRAPFGGGDRTSVMRGHLSAPPPVPSVRRRGIPPALDRVVVRALLKDPDLRYADAEEMRSALIAALPQAVLPAPAVTTATRALRPVETISSRAEPAAPASAAPERRAGGWGLVIGIIAVLVATATAVPLLAGTGRTAPPAEAVAPSDAPSPSASTAEPAMTAVPSATVVSTVVPALTTLGDAHAVLTAAGLRTGDVVTRDDASPAGTVLESDPAAGTPLPRGSAVRLVVASGSNAVPDVRGMDAAAALSRVSAAGFVPVTVTTVSSQPIGIALGVEPAAGASAPLGSSVRVLVAAAPVPTATPTPPAPTPTATVGPTSTPTPTTAPTPAG
ncbi:serine/threonine protein kinase [Microbacterium testaceum StLB037]|uniref:Serine/threonine protein kinase n=1 Tax=Microbacterium testaceum (strain StLB037) TaxID=979556 RepID=E8N7X5_MICTS|nr:PASTA domain-containing protein [Microbacterium testaceum]BAJ75595.1 serine/threonine protein kinase [Microbacterium testaceum StLB037]